MTDEDAGPRRTAGSTCYPIGRNDTNSSTVYVTVAPLAANEDRVTA